MHCPLCRQELMGADCSASFSECPPPPPTRAGLACMHACMRPCACLQPVYVDDTHARYLAQLCSPISGANECRPANHLRIAHMRPNIMKYPPTLTSTTPLLQACASACGTRSSGYSLSSWRSVQQRQRCQTSSRLHRRPNVSGLREGVHAALQAT